MGIKKKRIKRAILLARRNKQDVNPVLEQENSVINKKVKEAPIKVPEPVIELKEIPFSIEPPEIETPEVQIEKPQPKKTPTKTPPPKRRRNKSSKR